MRGIVKFLFGLVVVIAITWIGLWWYAEGRMQSGFTAWADELATQGWKVGYDGLQRGTSPAAATLTLTNLVLTVPAGGAEQGGTITLPKIMLRIDVLNPLVLHTDLPSKISADFGNDIDFAVTFGHAEVTDQLDPHVLFSHGKFPYRSGNFSAQDVDILASEGSLLVLHMDNIASDFAFDPAAGASSMALSLNESFDGISLSPLMTKVLSIPFDGKLTHLGLAVNVSGPVPDGLADMVAKMNALPASDEVDRQKMLMPVVHNWAAGGGNGNINLSGVVGPTTVASDAAVKFDANLQPEGTANVTADHLDQLTAAITAAYPSAQDDISQMEAQLSTYITTSDQGGQSLAMHVAYGSGTVNINGQKVTDMPPVDWNALENPPPAPPPEADAPGDGSGADDSGDNGSGNGNSGNGPGTAGP